MSIPNLALWTAHSSFTLMTGVNLTNPLDLPLVSMTMATPYY